MEDSLLEKTGKDLNQWIEIAKKSGIDKHGHIVKNLKAEHGLTHGYANLIALKTLETDAASFGEDELVDAQYSKGKEHLKEIYLLLRKNISEFGDDIEFVPKKSSVSCRRKKQFALIQPSTKTRIDLGLKFKNREIAGRLQASGPFGTMCSHRMILESAADVDEEVIQLIREAYAEAG